MISRQPRDYGKRKEMFKIRTILYMLKKKSYYLGQHKVSHNQQGKKKWCPTFLRSPQNGS